MRHKQRPNPNPRSSAPNPEVLIVGFGSDHVAAIKSIRSAVFSAEQGIDPLLDFDGRDPGALHALIRVNGEYVGTGRLLPEGRIGRLAVLAPHRRKGLGRLLVNALLAEARKRGMEWVLTGAQTSAMAFYDSLGFVPCGKPFVEAGIEHQLMARRIR